MKQVVKLLFKGAILFFFVLLAQGVVFQALAQDHETNPNPNVELKAGNPCSSGLEGQEFDGFVCQGGKWVKALENLPAGPQSFEGVLKIIDTITNWVFAGLMAVSVIMIMLAGFQFIMEGKDPAKVTEAKNKVLFAIGGIGIALVAKAVDPALRNLLGLQ